jgi:hypothetical protein
MLDLNAFASDFRSLSCSFCASTIEAMEDDAADLSSDPARAFSHFVLKLTTDIMDSGATSTNDHPRSPSMTPPLAAPIATATASNMLSVYTIKNLV